ncbi:unnamed protein product [Protopolystoma xenopodis]|uniref:Neurotransmitter-gated ion-channel transmembrane domain-containing protein n=1 Tax=Protopolystoma xenopodis TaxID=117903 RepID=A0A3S5ABG2_9PLAT|nr:unnamed protein product [Protopolystoma xenopodis]
MGVREVYRQAGLLPTSFHSIWSNFCPIRPTFWSIQVVLSLFNNLSFVDLSKYLKSGTWDIYECSGEVVNETTGSQRSMQVVYTIKLRRKTLFYTVNLIIPCVMVSFLSICVFYLPADAGEKMTLSISILLALVVFLLLISKILPPTSTSIPLISCYLLFAFIINIFAILVTVMIINWNYRTPRTHAMPHWLRWVFMERLPVLLGMQRPGHVVAELQVQAYLKHSQQRAVRETSKSALADEPGRPRTIGLTRGCTVGSRNAAVALELTNRARVSRQPRQHNVSSAFGAPIHNQSLCAETLSNRWRRSCQSFSEVEAGQAGTETTESSGRQTKPDGRKSVSERRRPDDRTHGVDESESNSGSPGSAGVRATLARRTIRPAPSTTHPSNGPVVGLMTTSSWQPVQRTEVCNGTSASRVASDTSSSSGGCLAPETAEMESRCRAASKSFGMDWSLADQNAGWVVEHESGHSNASGGSEGDEETPASAGLVYTNAETLYFLTEQKQPSSQTPSPSPSPSPLAASLDRPTRPARLVLTAPCGCQLAGRVLVDRSATATVTAMEATTRLADRRAGRTATFDNSSSSRLDLRRSRGAGSVPDTDPPSNSDGSADEHQPPSVLLTPFSPLPPPPPPPPLLLPSPLQPTSPSRSSTHHIEPQALVGKAGCLSVERTHRQPRTHRPPPAGQTSAASTATRRDSDRAGRRGLACHWGVDWSADVLQDWKYVASVIDRLMLAIFVLVTTVGTISLFSRAPYILQDFDQDDVIRLCSAPN